VDQQPRAAPAAAMHDQNTVPEIANPRSDRRLDRRTALGPTQGRPDAGEERQNPASFAPLTTPAPLVAHAPAIRPAAAAGRTGTRRTCSPGRCMRRGGGSLDVEPWSNVASDSRPAGISTSHQRGKPRSDRPLDGSRHATSGLGSAWRIRLASSGSSARWTVSACIDDSAVALAGPCRPASTIRQWNRLLRPPCQRTLRSLSGPRLIRQTEPSRTPRGPRRSTAVPAGAAG
jgi:hypothetical protein